MVPLLTQGAIWAGIGAVSGLVFAVGLGGRSRWITTLVGGLLGAAAAAIVYEIVGALAFPSDTYGSPPVSLDHDTRDGPIAGCDLLGDRGGSGLASIPQERGVSLSALLRCGWIDLPSHMELRNHTPGPAPGASARSATMGATRWTARQWVGRVAIGSVLLAVAACGIGLLVAWPRWFSDPLEQGRRAYDRGDWNAAARSAREILSMRKGDPAALGLLARSSVQLGRDDAAIRIYNRLLEAKTVRAEDYLLLGVVLKRQGQEDGAMWAWVQALEAEPVSAQTLARSPSSSTRWRSRLRAQSP